MNSLHAGICVSLILSLVLSGFNINDLIRVYGLQEPRWLPNNWNMFFNYSYLLCFYMWLGCTIYIEARDAAKKDTVDTDERTKYRKNEKNKWRRFIIVSFVGFVGSWILNIVTGMLIIDYHPADYLTD